MVIAGREGSWGRYVGFELDTEILQCTASACKQEYVLRYTKDEQKILRSIG